MAMTSKQKNDRYRKARFVEYDTVAKALDQLNMNESGNMPDKPKALRRHMAFLMYVMTDFPLNTVANIVGCSYSAIHVWSVRHAWVVQKNLLVELLNTELTRRVLSKVESALTTSFTSLASSIQLLSSQISKKLESEDLSLKELLEISKAIDNNVRSISRLLSPLVTPKKDLSAQEMQEHIDKLDHERFKYKQ
jgi:hypothetical protein